MSGRFLSPRDLSAAKHEMEIFNSMLKRGEVKAAERIVKTSHVVCGCGVPGCIFIHAKRDETEEQRKERLGY
jgi:uncharacterized UPF0160 family protein